MTHDKIESFLIVKYGSLESALEAFKDSDLVSVEMEGFTTEESAVLFKMRTLEINERVDEDDRLATMKKMMQMVG